MLGRDLVKRLDGDPAVTGITAIDRDEADITDLASVQGFVDGHQVVVNCAAWTDVDGAEQHEAEATAVNRDGARNLAIACRTAGARLVHLSTDYVFAGDASQPYDEDAEPNPTSAYGRSKAAGEVSVLTEAPDSLVVRSAWLYGAEGGCFPKTIARLLHERGSVTVVDDQRGQPTWTVDLADVIVHLVQTQAPAGAYHATSSGETSWFEFAREVAACAGFDPAAVSPTTTAAYPRPARRPAYSVLGHRRLRSCGLQPIDAWKARWTVAAAQVLR